MIEHNPKALSILASYAYLKDRPEWLALLLELSRRGFVNLLIDSGAFTAYNAGKEIKLSEYIEFCKKIHESVFQYIMLDVVNNEAESMHNFRVMVKQGLQPAPVWTTYSDEKALDEMLNITLSNGNDFLCLGGGLQLSDPHMVKRFRTVERKNKNIRMHGLAYVNTPQIYKLPLFSCDSSSWNSGIRFGNFMLWNHADKKFNCYDVTHVKRTGSKVPPMVKEAWTSHGLRPADRHNPDYFRGCKVSNVLMLFPTESYFKLQMYMKSLKKDYFFAVPDQHHFIAIIATAYAMAKSTGNVITYNSAFDYYEVQRTHAKLFNAETLTDKVKVYTEALEVICK